MKIANFLHFFYCMLLCHSTCASEMIKHDQIQAQVKQFLENALLQQQPESRHQSVKIDIKKIDQRLRLPQCDKKLALTLQGQILKRNNSVKVSCQSTTPWSMYVTSTLAIEIPIIISRYELPKHHILEASDLTTAKHNIYGLRSGYSTRLNSVVGKQLKRPLRSGHIVYNYQLQAPEVIKKGDRVTVVAKRGALAVTSYGIALSNGGVGDNIRVENQKSSRIIHAKAVAPGTVEVL